MTFTGNVDINPTLLSNSSATKLGLKSYYHGTTYNGNNAPTVSRYSGNGTLDSIIKAVFIPYQMQDGRWRLRFTIVATLSATARTTFNVQINGINFRNGIGESGYAEMSAHANTAAVLFVGALVNTNIMEIDYAISNNDSVLCINGDAELESKPTWAY
jgi:hypothetical protein